MQKNGATSPAAKTFAGDRDLEKLKRKLQRHEEKNSKEAKKRKRSLLQRVRTTDTLPAGEKGKNPRKSPGSAKPVLGSLFQASVELTKGPPRAED